MEWQRMIFIWNMMGVDGMTCPWNFVKISMKATFFLISKFILFLIVLKSPFLHYKHAMQESFGALQKKEKKNASLYHHEYHEISTT